MKPTYRLAAAALALACAPAAAQQAQPAAPQQAAPRTHADSVAAQTNALADEFMAVGIRRFPEIGTFYGLPGARHDLLADNSLATLHRYEQEDDAFNARVMALDWESLRGRPEYITLGFMRENAESGRGARVCHGELWGVNQLSGWQIQMPQLAMVQPVGTAELRRAALARFGQVPHYVDNEIEALREGLRQGYSAPKGNVRRVIEEMDAMLAAPVEQSPFYAVAQRDSDAAFRRDWANLITTQVNPAAKKYRDFLANEYLPKARDAVGVSALPNGEACYRASVRASTTLELDPQWIHRTGLEQMDSIQAQMLRIAQRSFNTSNVPALLERFRTDTAYTFRTRQQMVDVSTAAIGRAKAAMGQWFGTLPKADVIVVPYQEFEERSAPGASYEPPAADGSRPGRFRINTYQPEKQSRVGIESTAFHESIPGHHLQLALAQERPAAHMITRLLGNSGFSEGWGLYAESLADEMHLFSGDLDRMGLLSNQALRAARMVVDPGLHVMGWTRERAIDYMLTHTAESRTSVENEVDRYIVWPGQATAYMTGMLTIRSLRDEAQRELGPRFDIRAFHDRVLEDGTVTLPMLRDKIHRWIQQEKAAAH
ncbi:MAG: DUF885 domain-containing protein [Gemmatimonadetes bacterium]|nr:DUF885 domain-containing protein [Gemmatimonadota bacterium]